MRLEPKIGMNEISKNILERKQLIKLKFVFTYHRQRSSINDVTQIWTFLKPRFDDFLFMR